MENKSGLRTEPWAVPVLVGDGLRDSMNCVVKKAGYPLNNGGVHLQYLIEEITYIEVW